MEPEQVARAIDRAVKELFPAGAVARAELLRHGDDPAIGPGQLMVRVVVPGRGGADVLAAWAGTHRQQMDELRREASLRLPAARLLEFVLEDGDTSAAAIRVPDDGSLAAEQLSGREIVAKAVALLRENYVFPDQAERVAAGIEARLAAGEYDDLDEITLTELLTGHLQEASGDKHLGVRLGGGPPPRRDQPGRDGPARHDAPGDRDEPEDHEARRLKMRRRGRLDNFGIHRVERLDGNIGYLDLRRVPVPENVGPAIAAAMEQTTGGGAHPTRPFPISAAVHIGIPYARSINPVTGTNWQGTGVMPDTAVPADQARDTAYAKALRHVLQTDDVPPPIADEARAALATIDGVLD